MPDCTGSLSNFGSFTFEVFRRTTLVSGARFIVGGGGGGGGKHGGGGGTGGATGGGTGGGCVDFSNASIFSRVCCSSLSANLRRSSAISNLLLFSASSSFSYNKDFKMLVVKKTVVLRNFRICC